MGRPLISVRDLTIQFNTDEGTVTAVKRVSFDIAPGEVMGLVGESGSGKSVTAKALMRLNAPNSFYGPDSRIILSLDDREIDVLALKSPSDLKIIRGGAVSMVFQEPMASFAPALTIGSQMAEALMIHLKVSKHEAKNVAIDMLTRVGVSDASSRFDQYVVELSGGMRQRAMIAMALSTKPKLLIADEPTTALDVTIQAQVLELMQDLVEEFHMAILFITHDLGVIAQTADHIAVMYLGQLMETGTTRSVIHQPRHPYTRGLLNAIPKLDELDAPLVAVSGDIPSPLERPTGCVFHTRCSEVIEGRCATVEPEIKLVGQDHDVACFAVELADEERAEKAAL
jgi:oligopeptide/dipeptide ABC transporter ATP-binding protein|tara:strand:+ start:921 stop:1943 length:1023 start_codon:yes stop_codon:yes gene_type:complete